MPAQTATKRDSGTFGAGLQPEVIVWGLVLLGFVLVCLAGPLGQSLVQKTPMGPNSYGWNPNEAREIAQNLR